MKAFLIRIVLGTFFMVASTGAVILLVLYLSQFCPLSWVLLLAIVLSRCSLVVETAVLKWLEEEVYKNRH